ncbi:prepilin-type N-terminal cleavage/methylation domain-containing protein [Patescibacteria group bacterium]|nr:prepilin-type N-terminal cleavage/methylation domain-containing protein [Patescibacteria group bacterium]
MLKCFNVKIKKGGFTLIEMLAAVMIFSLIIGAISGVFISSFRSQKNALSSQRLLNQTSYALEYMSRALRMSNKQTADIPTCLSQSGLNYEITHSGSGLKFINHLENDDCQEFFLENKQLKQKKNNLTETVELTSSNLEITSLNFFLQGESQNDNLQPRVTIFLAVKGKGQKPEEQPEIKIQTTISQRNLDIHY